MNPFLSNEMARERIADLQREAARPRRHGADNGDKLTLRLSEPRDVNAIVRLARLDDKPIPMHRMLVAELAGQIVAALPLGGGPVLVDPFRHTKNVVELLKLRAEQLGGGRKSRWRRRRQPSYAI